MSKKIINVGVLLSDDPILREALSSEDMIDRFIEPKNVDQMLGYFRQLARKGLKIGRLALVGHGNAKNPKVGILELRDLDLKQLYKRRQASMENQLDLDGQIRSINRQIAGTEDSAKRKELSDVLDGLQQQLANVKDEYREKTAREEAFRDIQNLMDKDAMIGVFSCWAGAGTTERPLLNAIANALLSMNGGSVFGNDGRNNFGYRKTLINWLTESKPYVITSEGNWQFVKKKGSGVPFRCGVACRDFQRYGFCDNPAGKDGGPCHWHR